MNFLCFQAQFWLEGVAIIVVGLFGMCGNLITIVVLRRIDTNITFNRLLMTLGKAPKWGKHLDLLPQPFL